MGKQDVNVSAELEDIEHGAKLLVEAAAHREKGAPKKGHKTSADNKFQGPEPAVEKKATTEQIKDTTSRPKQRAKLPRPIPFPERQEERVNMSSKVLPSQKRRLKELALKRELFGLHPYKLQDLMEEALQYLFEKYEAETKKAANS